MPAEPGSSGASVEGDLLEDGVVVRSGFISRPRTIELNLCAALRRDRGDFVAARVGGGGQLQERPDIRGDTTCWLTEPLFGAERALLADLEELRLKLNREAYLGLFDLELHYAHYPVGRGYARHLDQLQGREQRRVSVVLYLNEAWEAGCGGELRIFDSAGYGASGYRDIEPAGGRLVYFLTDAREHEVLPTRCERLSVSGWFRTRD